MGLCLAAVGGAAQPGAADGLGDGALDAGADVVAGFPLRGLLLGALPGKEFVLLAGQQGQAASPLAIGRLGAPGSQRARVAVGGREMDPGNGGAVGFALVGPADADRPLGAGDLACVPVDAEGGLVQGRFLPGAAAPGVVRVGADRPGQGDAVAGAGGEDVAGADVARVCYVLARRHLAAAQVLVDDRGHLAVICGRVGGLQVGDHPGHVRIAGLGQVRLAARPAGSALDPVAGVQVVGGGQPLRARREVVALPPAHLRPVPVVLLVPDSPSAYCSTDTSASAPGETAGWPSRGKAAAKSSSANSRPSASRIRIAKVPLGNAASTTRAVSSGTPSSDRGSSDTSSYPPVSDHATQQDQE